MSILPLSGGGDGGGVPLGAVPHDAHHGPRPARVLGCALRVEPSINGRHRRLLRVCGGARGGEGVQRHQPGHLGAL
eukprot:2851349-Pyramimonas_sp.AAC.2